MQQENADLTRQLEEAESGGSALTKLRAQLSAQLEDLKRSLEEETRVSLLLMSFIVGLSPGVITTVISLALNLEYFKADLKIRKGRKHQL